jgi:hypothetical protein
VCAAEISANGGSDGATIEAAVTATSSLLDGLDSTRFPRVASYLRKLPAGLASYPECTTKASLYRSALEDKPLADAEYLPAPLVELAERSTLTSIWVPSVHVQALYIALCDAHALGLRDFARWSAESTGRLLGGPLYRMIAAIASPSALLQGAKFRWSAMHRGTELQVAPTSTGAVVTMTFPENLYGMLNLAGFAGGFEAILHHSHAKDASVEVVASSATSARFNATWA